jgi:hypothetical protein
MTIWGGLIGLAAFYLAGTGLLGLRKRTFFKHLPDVSEEEFCKDLYRFTTSPPLTQEEIISARKEISLVWGIPEGKIAAAMVVAEVWPDEVDIVHIDALAEQYDDLRRDAFGLQPTLSFPRTIGELAAFWIEVKRPRRKMPDQ